MKDKTSDRRVRKTKKALKESLSSLMEEKNIREISVQELTDMADLNRATFYLHYKDIYDLQQQIEDEVVDEIDSILVNHIASVESGEPYSMFVKMLTYITENPTIFKMFLGKNSNRSLIDKLCYIVENRWFMIWLDKYPTDSSDDELAYFSNYIVYGYVAVIVKWVESGMKESPEVMAKMMGDMGLYGIAFLEKYK